MHRLARSPSFYRRLSTAPNPLPQRSPTVTSVADLFDDHVTNHILAPSIAAPNATPTVAPPPATHMRDAVLYNPSEQSLYERQLKLEQYTIETAVQRYRNMASAASQRGDVVTHRPAADLLLSWYSPLSLSIRDAFKSTSSSSNVKSRHRVPLSQHDAHLLASLSPDTISVITLHVVLGTLIRESNGVPLTRLAMNVANTVRAEINVKKINALQKQQQEAEQLLESQARHEQASKRKPRNRKPHDVLNHAMKNSSSMVSAVNFAAQQIAVQDSTWTSRELVLIGTKLIDLMIRCAKVQAVDGSFVPAISHFKRFRKSEMTTVGMLQLTECAVRTLSENEIDLSPVVAPKRQPMLVRPRPWTSPNDGPYLRCRAPLVRTIPSAQHDLKDALAVADLSTLFDGLNALGDQPWRVNRCVYDVAQELWRQGGGIAGLVTKTDASVPHREEFMREQMAIFERRKQELMEWREQEEADSDEEEITFDEKRANRKLRAERRKAQKINRELLSLRADTYHRLHQASQFVDEDRFWLPHNVDFRGRAYPIPVHLQHMGCDLTRALLTFASPGVALGKRGVYWLKIHLANLLGADKLSFEERVEVAEAAMAKVIEVGREPLNEQNLEWWSSAEDPFQLLAACSEVAAAVGRYGGSRAMEGYESTLPISMDGSCNGLQHYAALGRDVAGGVQVNLVPNDRPQDVYSGVAELVREKVARLADEGDEIAQLVRDKITRKVVKQTVMTSVYGVTLIGARQQVANRLSELGTIPEERVFAASMLVASLTLSSLGDLFSGAWRTMEWLAESAALVAKTGEEVRWTTPIGLPATQPYRRRDGLVVRTLLQRVRLQREGGGAVSAQRQRSAFAPNFVHSVDSAHMVLTAMACRRAGLNFAAVHDSFWTNAARVDEMNALLREQFVELHERDLLRELRDSLLLRFGDVPLRALPPRGSLQLHVVRHSPYFFS
eukprot:TRINITY_DN135_c0_g1_i10.p2 TRINITY_DN135_c0_g1~~TRINITY_DN135_c0_g1_i10.p2  ORF type:complete len:953 (-),score=153.11 TRINITY_DN135_c0_g1_i10:16304-19162(-)